MRQAIFVLLFVYSSLSAQMVGVSTFDSIDWQQLPERLENSRYYIFEGKSGEVLSIGAYQKGKKHGMFLDFQGGAVTERNYQKGTLHGYYADPEKKGLYQKGKEHGVWEFNIAGKGIEKISFLKGMKDGPYLYKTGDLEVRGSYKKNNKHGFWKEVSEDSYQEKRYRAGSKYGIWVTKMGDDFEERISYNKNRKAGLYQLFRFGNIEIEGNYKMGMKEGEWTYYNEAGEVIRIEIYESDSIVGESKD